MGFHSDFFWRTTGLPWQLLDDLACHRNGPEIDHVLTRTSASTRPWAAVEPLVAAESAATGLTARLGEEFATSRTALAKLAGDEDLGQFVSQTSVEASSALARVAGRDPQGPRNWSVRRDERLVLRYLQRAVGRCETVGRFGPVARGRFGDFPRPLDHDFDDVYRPRAFASYRWVDSICWAARARPEVLGELDIRTTQGLLDLGDDRWWHPLYGAFTVGTHLAGILRQAQESRVPVRELRSRFGPGVDTTLVQLLRHGLIWDRLGLALAAPQPSRVLLRVLQATGACQDLVELTARIDGLRLRWPRLAPQGRRRAVAGILAAADRCAVAAPGRGPYSDHLPVYEDGLAPGRTLRVDREWAAPYLSAIEEYLLDHVPASGGRPLVLSPDVMIGSCGRPGDHDGHVWVLSEVHRSVSAVSFPERHLPHRAASRRRTARFLAAHWPDMPLAAITTFPLNKTHYCGPLPGVNYLEGGSPWVGDPARLADETWLAALRSRLRAGDRVTPDDLVLLPTPVEPAPDLADVVMPRPDAPGRSGHGTEAGPRVTHNGVVIARMRQELPVEVLPGRDLRDAELLLWSRHLRAVTGLPRLVFVRRPGPHKPMLIDLDNVVSVEELVHLRRQDTLTPLLLEEMLPTPQQAIAVTDGGRYLSELRLLFAGTTR